MCKGCVRSQVYPSHFRQTVPSRGEHLAGTQIAVGGQCWRLIHLEQPLDQGTGSGQRPALLVVLAGLMYIVWISETPWLA